MPPPRKPPPKKKKKNAFPEATPEQIIARGRGALTGLAIGDAFGSTFEGKKLQAPLFPELCGGVYVDPIGKGPHNLRLGQVTDETQMAVALATVLNEQRRYELEEVGKQYARWMPHAFDVDPITKDALALLVDGRTAEYTGRRLWLESRPRPESNNSLGRTAPIGVLFHKDQTRRIEASMVDSAVTHFDPRCQLACVMLNAGIAACLSSAAEVATPDEIVKQVEGDIVIAAADLGRKFPELIGAITDSVEWLREDFRLARTQDPELYGPDLHLWLNEKSVRVALRIAFWELFHAPDFEQALIDVVNRGGDSDTNAAITGALYGAWVGEAKIPPRWIEMVMDSMHGDLSPLGTTYHPRNLLPLAGTTTVPNAPAEKSSSDLASSVIKV